MLLQIDNIQKDLVEGIPATLLVDYVEGITHTKAFSDGIKCFKKDGTEILVIRKMHLKLRLKILIIMMDLRFMRYIF